jgi:hypothetical protein
MRHTYLNGVELRGQTSSGLYVAGNRRLWTPESGNSGLIVAAQAPSLLAVVGVFVTEVAPSSNEITMAGGLPVSRGEGRPVTLGGLVIMSGSRHKEPTRVIGHPDLASGASVQRGDTLYVSVAEAIYRESRGEYVEVHLTPTAFQSHEWRIAPVRRTTPTGRRYQDPGAQQRSVIGSKYANGFIRVRQIYCRTCFVFPDGREKQNTIK